MIKFRHALLCLCTAGITFFCGCKKDNSNKVYTEDAYVIGVNPCTGAPRDGRPEKGYVVLLSKRMDSVLVCNLPIELVKEVDARPNLLLEEGCFFSPAIRGNFKRKITYKYASEDEYKIEYCMAIYDMSGISKINKQIIIVPQ